jgi:NAD(P)H dehydrogenase (quinone)
VRVAVTAASGRLGHATLRELLALAPPVEVVAVARSPDKVAIAGVEKRAGDYASVESMTAALRDIDSVVMISAPAVAGSDRVALHRNAIEAARRAGVRSLLYTSVIGSEAVAGTLFEPFQQVNRETEALVQACGIPWIIARNGLYLELDLKHIREAARTGGVYANPGGAGRAPYITIDEIAYACARLATSPGRCGRVYNIVGECLSQAELVALANEVFGLDVRYQTMSDDDCTGRFRKLMPERGEAVARMLTGCFQCIRIGAFDVPSDYEAAAGRPVKSVRAMMENSGDSSLNSLN